MAESFERFQAVAALLLSDSEEEAKVALTRLRRIAKDLTISAGDFKEMLQPADQNEDIQRLERQNTMLREQVATMQRALAAKEERIVRNAMREARSDFRWSTVKTGTMMLFGLAAFVLFTVYIFS